MKDTKGRVHLPNFFAILGSAVFFVFVIPAIITILSGEPLWVPILFFLFSLVGLSFVIGFINCRISYDDNGFTVKNFFGVKRCFSYDQITATRENVHDIRIYIGKKKVLVDLFSVGGIDFITFAHKKYRTLFRGHAIPKIEKDKNDIFNGNVLDTTGFLIAYIAVSIAILAFAVLLIFHIFTPASVENTIEEQVVFTSFVYEEDLTLVSSDGIFYRTDLWNGSHDPSEITSLCDDKTEVTVYFVEATDKNDNSYNRIKALYHKNDPLITFEETNKLWVRTQGPILLIPIIAGILWAGYIAASIVVGRNPQKYGHKVVRLFFKDGYVIY